MVQYITMDGVSSICGLCSHPFKDISQLVTHIQSHLPIYPPECHRCGRHHIVILAPTHFCGTCSLSQAPATYDTPRSTRVVRSLEEELESCGIAIDPLLDEITANEENNAPVNKGSEVPFFSRYLDPVQMKSEMGNQEVNMAENVTAPVILKNQVFVDNVSVANPGHMKTETENQYVDMDEVENQYVDMSKDVTAPVTFKNQVFKDNTAVANLMYYLPGDDNEVPSSSLLPSFACTPPRSINRHL